VQQVTQGSFFVVTLAFIPSPPGRGAKNGYIPEEKQGLTKGVPT